MVRELNVIIPFCIIVGCLDVMFQKSILVNQNGATVRGKSLSGPSIATALQMCILTSIFEALFFHCLFPKNNIVKNIAS